MKKVLQITVYTNTAASELVADVLCEAGSEGVSVYDSADIAALISSDLVWDYIDEDLLRKDPVVRVTGFFENGCDTAALDARLALLKEMCPFDTGSLETSSEWIDADAWVDTWRKYYKPVHAGRVVIVPEWMDYSPAEGEVTVLMDPGMAFGTGEHESTRICLELLQSVMTGGERVLDIGTGSGILAVAAAKLGAECVDACDIDPIAVKAAGQNAQRNGVSDKVNVGLSSCLTCAEGGYDVILANITADVLISMKDDIGKYLSEGGCVIMSGIILSRAKDVEQAYSSAGFSIEKAPVKGEWTGYLWR